LYGVLDQKNSEVTLQDHVIAENLTQRQDASLRPFVALGIECNSRRTAHRILFSSPFNSRGEI
jgi:hypothetical protein